MITVFLLRCDGLNIRSETYHSFKLSMVSRKSVEIFSNRVTMGYPLGKFKNQNLHRQQLKILKFKIADEAENHS